MRSCTQMSFKVTTCNTSLFSEVIRGHQRLRMITAGVRLLSLQPVRVCPSRSFVITIINARLSLGVFEVTRGYAILLSGVIRDQHKQCGVLLRGHYKLCEVVLVGHLKSPQAMRCYSRRSHKVTTDYRKLRSEFI